MRISIAALSFLVSACGAATYVPPQGQSVAILTIENLGIDLLPVHTYADGRTCSGRRTIHPGVRASSPISVAVAPGEPLTFTVEGSYTYTSRGEPIGRILGVGTCPRTGTFVPSAGRRYLARYEINPGKEACALSVWEEFRNNVGRPTRYLEEPSFQLRLEPACK